jgi:hypothetical protein
MSNKNPIGPQKSIQRFEPMDMIGLDYIALINPPCSLTGAKQIIAAIIFQDSYEDYPPQALRITQ